MSNLLLYDVPKYAVALMALGFVGFFLCFGCVVSRDVWNSDAVWRVARRVRHWLA